MRAGNQAANKRNSRGLQNNSESKNFNWICNFDRIEIRANTSGRQRANCSGQQVLKVQRQLHKTNCRTAQLLVDRAGRLPVIIGVGHLPQKPLEIFPKPKNCNPGGT
jgi:hypothetical protein